MQGRILSYDAVSGEGRITGAGSVTYLFVAADVVSGQPLSAGQQVDFTATSGGLAQKIVVMAPAHEAGGRFDMGRVIRRTFTSVAKNWALFFGVSAVLVGLPSLLSTWGQVKLGAGFGMNAVLAMGGGFLLYLTGYYLLQGMVLKAALNTIEGRQITFATAFNLGLRVVLPLLGLSILAVLGIGVGLMLLFVPGLVLCVLWSVATPVLVLERRGIFRSFGRSIDLVKGYGWSVFGLFLIYMLLTWLLSVAIGAVLGGILAAVGVSDISTFKMTIEAVVNTVTAVIAAAGAAALYYELKVLKEGFGEDELAAIFD